MLKSKFIDIVKTFSKEEFKEFNFVRDYDAEELAPASAPVRRKSARNKGIPENEE